MFPYKDDNPTERFPLVTVLIIAANAGVFVWQIAGGATESVVRYGIRPAALFGHAPTELAVNPAASVVMSMFMHGGVLHLGGNMLYLWIFGNNIEDRLGKFRFIIFYLLGGAVAAYAHALSAPSSTVPMIGASGAVSAVLGAYLLLYPRARVHTLLILGFWIQVVMLPALIVIGFWAIIQVANGLMSAGRAGDGGVAWFAHVGGFIYGLAAIKVFLPRIKPRRLEEWS